MIIKNPYFFSRENCPICSSNENMIIYEQPYTREPIRGYLDTYYSQIGGVEFSYLRDVNYSLLECQNCYLIFQKYVPNDEMMKRLYDKWIDPELTYKKHLEQDDLNYFSLFAQEVMQLVAYFQKTPSELHFFDFGMGWGKWALMAKAFGCNSYGSELSEKRIEHSRANGITPITWKEIPEHQFDLINAEQVFEHLSEPLETLLHLKKGLKPKGLIKISVPTAIGMKRRLKRMDWDAEKDTKNSLNAVAPLEHINFFRRKSLITLASLTSLSEVFIPLNIQYRYATNWSGVTRISRNLLLPIFRNVLKIQNYIFLTKPG